MRWLLSQRSGFALTWFGQASNTIASPFALLTRELTEQSARKRTYVARILYASLLYGFVMWTFWREWGGWSHAPLAFLGRGRQLFEPLAWLQFWGIYLFLPAITCGVITIEKERDTLSLLLLTRLGPWSILCGKLFSRMIPMATFLLLSLPVFAVTYSMGGVESNEILSLAWWLMATVFQVGALSVACSAWCRTTSGAFMATYAIGAFVMGGPILFLESYNFDMTGIVEFLNVIGGSLGLYDYSENSIEHLRFLLFGPWLCLHPANQGIPFSLTVVRSLPILTFGGICLLFGRMVLWNRAFVRPSNYLLKAFRALDGAFHQLNQNRLTRGIILIRESVELPENDPIRWRETTKRSLGTTRYLVRMMLVLEPAVLFGLLIPNRGHYANEIGSINMTWVLLWIVATLLIAIQSTGLIGAERSRQTLDVLLTTPITSDVIIHEKFAGIWRLIRVLWIPFLTIIAFHFWWEHGLIRFAGDGDRLFILIRGILTLSIYPPLIAWMGFYFGMRYRSQAQATVVTLGTITAICVLPIVIAQFVFRHSSFFAADHFLLWFSPAYVLSLSPDGMMYWRSGPMAFIIHFAITAAALFLLRVHCQRSFVLFVDRNDGRTEGEE